MPRGPATGLERRPSPRTVASRRPSRLPYTHALPPDTSTPISTADPLAVVRWMMTSWIVSPSLTVFIAAPPVPLAPVGVPHMSTTHRPPPGAARLGCGGPGVPCPPAHQ